MRRPSGAIVVVKGGWFWKALHYIVVGITLGGNRKFLTNYWTTFGRWIAAPVGTDISDPTHEPIVVHEEVHVTQFKAFGLGIPEIGILPMGIAYLLLPLPLGFAWCRWRFERTAYAAGIRAWIALGHDRRRLIDHATNELTTGRYGWTWIIRSQVRSWFERNV